MLALNTSTLPWKLVALDFDGVVVQSPGVKHALFVKVAAEVDAELAHELQKELRQSLAASERRKVAEWLTARSNGKIQVHRFLERFSQVWGECIDQIPLVRGITDFLSYVSAQKIPMVILSAAPEPDIFRILRARGICADRFADILGSERGAKIDQAKLLAPRFDVAPAEIVLFGDTPADARVALQSGFQFVRVTSSAGEQAEWPAIEFPRITDFTQLNYSPAQTVHGLPSAASTNSGEIRTF
jgi:beta-phosphoglucomutase-like phosphatase (HAD superfamily)